VDKIISLPLLVSHTTINFETLFNRRKAEAKDLAKKSDVGVVKNTLSIIFALPNLTKALF